MVDFGKPPYDFILVIGFNKTGYERFKELYPENPKLRVLKLYNYTREEIDYLNGSGIPAELVYRVSTPDSDDLDNMRKYASEIYE